MDILIVSSSRYSAGIYLLFGQDQPDGSQIKNVGDDRGRKDLRREASGVTSEEKKQIFTSFPLTPYTPNGY